MEDLTHRCMYDSLTRSGFCDSSTVPNFPSGGEASAWWKSQKHFCTDIEICLFCSFGLFILIVHAGSASNICETETKTICSTPEESSANNRNIVQQTTEIKVQHTENRAVGKRTQRPSMRHPKEHMNSCKLNNVLDASREYLGR